MIGSRDFQNILGWHVLTRGVIMMPSGCAVEIVDAAAVASNTPCAGGRWNCRSNRGSWSGSIRVCPRSVIAPPRMRRSTRLARRASTSKGSYRMTVLTITVRDHGRGIAPGDLPHVFERFYRGADATRGRSGTGMGLAIARGMLAVEGGRISVENCAGGGARFTIVVPAEVK